MTLINQNEATTVVRADQVAGPPQGHWTYQDYAALPDDASRYEIIDGVLFMPPAPNLDHQSANGRFSYYLLAQVEFTGLGRVFSAPIDVELSKDNLVQPDVAVVLKENFSILTPTRIVGTPDLVVEIASPGTARYDRTQKLQAYQTAGVSEYWLVDLPERTVELLRLTQGVYQSAGIFQGQQILPSRIVPNLTTRVEQFFY